MTVITKINTKENIIIHRFSEVVSLFILTETIRKTIANSEYRAGMNAIWVCEDDTKIDMCSEDAKKLSDIARQAFDKEGKKYRLALVGSSDLAYGMNRVYEGWSNDRPVSINSFRELDSALAWIKSPMVS